MIQIDYQDQRPIYEQIVDRYELLILKGILEPDTQMPSVRQMASELSINPNTIQKAYAILEMNGYIYSVKGKGNFISSSLSLLDQRREKWKEKFSAAIREGREIGISLSDSLKEVEKIYSGQDTGQEEKGSAEQEAAGRYYD